MRKLIPITFLTVLFSCAQEVNTTLVESERIIAGNGPEDILIDNSTGHARLIISCGDFRNSDNIKRSGAIYSYDFQSGNTSRFTTDLPDTIPLIPHGISLLAGNPARLYVINHSYGNDEKKHAILIFTISENELHLEQVIKDEKYLTSPNDLTVLPDGSFYITNTGPFTAGSFFKRMFTSLSNVTFYNASTKSFTVAYDKIWVANGIHVIGNKLYVANSFTNKLYELDKAPDGSLTLNKKIKIAKQMDNLSFDVTSNKLYIASHDSFVKLSKSRIEGNSPFTVHSLDLSTYQVNKVMNNDGSLISGVSTALYYNDHVYLSQIFGNYIAKVKLK
jgi:hypothetical protein